MDLLFRAKRAYENTQKNKKIDKSEFMNRHPFEKRLEESKRILDKYPNRIPVICERISNNIPKQVSKKYLCPDDLSLANFMYVIRKRMNLSSEKALYLFINNKLVPCSQLLGSIYEAEKNEDGFLYINYAGESTFG